MEGVPGLLRGWREADVGGAGELPEDRAAGGRAECSARSRADRPLRTIRLR